MKFDIVLIDDHSLVLEGLKTLLRDIAGVNSVCTVTNGTELLSLIKSRIFHIYITDLELPDIDGFELMHSIKENNPQAKVIVCTMHEEIWIVNKLRHPDINAVVFKSSGTEALREAVCAVMVDESRPDDETELPDMLPTSRELDVLKAIAQGMSTHEISRHLFISENTVEWHRKNLMLKFAARNATDLVIKALTKGYLTIPL